MQWFIEHTTSFFIDNFPSWRILLLGSPIALAWAYFCLYFSGVLKHYKGLRTGYTRKVFHFLIFGSVVVIQWVWDTPAVCVFGGMTSIIIFYAVLRGPGHLMYEAMAREKDEPRRTHYIIMPYFATLIGGLVSNILFGPVAVVGYLVTGLGDAVGEPVGTKFGRHTYKVPSLTSIKAVRSWEGTSAVITASFIAVVAGVAISPHLEFTLWCLLTIPLVALISAGVEAVSPHGWDNLTMQVIPTLLAKLLISGIVE